MNNFNTTTIKSLSEFTTQLETRIGDRYKILLFRGQPMDQPLIPKIARHLYKKSREIDERRMLQEFSVSSVQYLNYKPTSDLERLTIAQHHGLPTRLLDWTENALTALYFAVSTPSEKVNQAVVWVMTVPRDSDILINNQDEKKDFFKEDKLRLFKPASIIPRISSQLGWFTLHPFKGQGFYTQAEKINYEGIKLSKILIENGCEKSIKENLEVCGINRHSIFKDLDSLGEYVFKKFEK
tara:strand:- start:1922 stop:2638 length:717 start_codon:yes stop_codon:yes gene_type:complete